MKGVDDLCMKWVEKILIKTNEQEQETIAYITIGVLKIMKMTLYIANKKRLCMKLNFKFSLLNFLIEAAIERGFHNRYSLKLSQIFCKYFNVIRFLITFQPGGL